MLDTWDILVIPPCVKSYTNGAWSLVLWMMVSVTVVKEVKGFCQVYNKQLPKPMLTYIKETCLEVTIYQ